MSTTMSKKWLKSKQVKCSGPSPGSASLWTCACVCFTIWLTDSKPNLSAETLLTILKPYAIKNSCCACIPDAIWAFQSGGLGRWLRLVEKMKLIWKLVKDSKRISSGIVILTPRHKQGGIVCTRTLLNDFGCRPQDLVEFSCLQYTHASSLPRHKHRRCLAASLDPGWCIY